MRRILIIIAAGLGVLFAMAAIGALVLFNTDAGRALVIAQAETRIGAALGGSAEIGALTGAPPGRIVMSDIVLADDDGPWLRIARIEIHWRPLKLLNKNIDIELLLIDGANLMRPPAASEKPETQPGPLKISLPDHLPSVRVAALKISNFVTGLGAETARLDGAGALTMGGRRINAQLNVNGANNQDMIDVIIDLNPREDRLFIEAVVAAQPNGAIAALTSATLARAALTGLDGPLSIKVNSDTPINKAAIIVDATIANYGAVEVIITGDLEALNGAAAEGVFHPGPGLAGIAELADEIVFNIRADDTRRGAVVTLNRLETAAGNLSGELIWVSDRRGVKSLNATLAADLASGYRQELQSVFGSDINTEIAIKRLARDYSLNARITGSHASLDITDAMTDLATRLSGDIAVNIEPRPNMLPGMPPGMLAVLANGVQLTGFIEADFAEHISLNGLSLKLDDTSSLGGDLVYKIADKPVFQFNGDATLSPALITMLAPSLKAESPLTVDIDFNGPVDEFYLKATINTPALTINGDKAPPLEIKAAMNGLPLLPTGDITARALGNASGQFTASLRSSRNGVITIPSLDYTGNGFKLSGSGALAPQRQHMEIDLTYSGDDNAEPWPGLNVSGELTLKGALSRKDTQTDFTLRSNILRAAGVSVANLSAQAKGPPGAVTIDITADTAAAGGQTLTNLSARALVNAADIIEINLQAFEAIFDTVKASLTQPAIITLKAGALKDAARIDGLRIAWGRNGAIAVDGVFSPARWQSKMSFNNVNTPRTDSQINLALNLDTDRKIPAQGEFQLRSLLTRNQEAAISGAFMWDGAILNLSSEKHTGAIDMNINLPVRLRRKPALSVEIDGALSGQANYNGEIDVIAGYLPPALQSLEGVLNASFQLAGTIDAPQLSGRAAITNGAYTEPQSGFSLTGVHTEADAKISGGASVIMFTGGARGADQTGADTITLTGNITLDQASSINLSLALNDAALSAHPVRSIRASGDINITGPLDDVSATGEIVVDELNAEIITPQSTGLVPITVIDANGDRDGLNGNGAVQPASFTYDINVTADDRIFVRGRGLESEWRASLRTVSLRGAPLVLGEANLRRGAFDFAGRRFDLSRGRITFDRLSANNPLLDIRAEYDAADGVTAIIAVTGRAAQPSIELVSTPVLPSSDIMALVLFGKSADTLSPVESLQTAHALASLGGVGPFASDGGIIGSLRDTVGLDLLNFDLGAESGGGSLTIGKYVADGFFVSATQDAQGQNGSVRVEYDVTDNFSVETEIAQDGDQTVSANWKKDF